MSQSIPLTNRKQLTSPHSHSNLSHHSDIEDSILEERLRIANFVLPEDNLEDLLRLPIAPELISRKLRQQKQQEQQKQLLLPITPPSTSPPSLPPSLEQHHEQPTTPELPQQPKPTKIQKPRINTSTSSPSINHQEQHHSQPPSSSTSTLPNRTHSSKPNTPVNKFNPPTKAPRTQRSFSTQTATQSQRERSKSSVNNHSVPSSSRKTTQARSVLGENNHNNHQRFPTKEKTPSTTSTARYSRPKNLKLRPRSLSAGSLQDGIGSTSSSTAPWNADPSPRIYRVDVATNSALDASDFKPPSHDDLILPTVARQIEKQSKLLAINDTDHPTYSSVSSHFPQWEALGPQLLLRKASFKQPDSSVAPPSASHSSHDPVSSRVEHLLTPTTPGSGWPRGRDSVGREDETTSPGRMSRGQSSSGRSSGPNSPLDSRQEMGPGGHLSPRRDDRRGLQQQQQQRQASSSPGTSPIRQQSVSQSIRSPQRDPPSENPPHSATSFHQPEMPPHEHMSSQEFPPPNTRQSHSFSHDIHPDQVVPVDQDSNGCCKCIIV